MWFERKIAVIPAVDVLGGESVRLRQGSYDDVVEWADPPTELAGRWVAAGARRIHLVDLDGARSGRVRPELLANDPRDYDVEHYVRLLRENFAARLQRAFTPDDFAAVFADPDQSSLFPPLYDGMRPVLRELPAPVPSSLPSNATERSPAPIST